MIRVAHLLPTLEIGGRERIVADLCRTAERHAIEPVLVTFDRPAPGRTLIDTPGVRTIALDRRHPAFREHLRTALAQEQIQVLHAQGHLPLALAAGATAGVPTLATMHIALGPGWRWLVPLVRGLRSANHLTAVSQDLTKRYGWLAGRPIQLVPTGVDLARFAAPATSGGSDGRPFTLGIAARLHPVKRLDIAVEAIRLLMQRRGMRCRLLVAGEGPWRQRIETLAQGCDIELLGALTDMPAFLRRLDAFLLTSDHEGTPAALLEAMATGLPCIATRVGGIPALLGNAGMLVPRRDPPAIADAIEKLMGNAALREQMGAAAAQHARSYSLERQAQTYADIYREMIGTRQAHRHTAAEKSRFF